MDKLLRRQQVEEIVGLNKSRIYVLMRDDKFPLPLRVGGKAVRWRESELSEWIETRERSSGWS